MRLAKLQTGTKLLGSFGIVSLLILLVSAVALWRMQASDRLTEDLVKDKLAKQQLVSDLLGIERLNGSRTISIARSEFANTSLLWCADGSAGLRFERPMTMRALTELIEYAGQRACGLYYERRVGELLEVVPANDRRE